MRGQHGSIQPAVLVGLLVTVLVVAAGVRTLDSSLARIDGQRVADITSLGGAGVQAMVLDANAVANDAILALHGLELMIATFGSLAGAVMSASVVLLPYGIETLATTAELTYELLDVNREVARVRDELNRWIAPGLVLALVETAGSTSSSGIALPYPVWPGPFRLRSDESVQPPQAGSQLSWRANGESCAESLSDSSPAGERIFDNPDSDAPQPPARLDVQAVSLDPRTIAVTALFRLVRQPLQHGEDKVAGILSERIALSERVEAWQRAVAAWSREKMMKVVDDLMASLPPPRETPLDRERDVMCDLAESAAAKLNDGADPGPEWRRGAQVLRDAAASEWRNRSLQLRRKVRTALSQGPMEEFREEFESVREAYTLVRTAAGRPSSTPPFDDLMDQTWSSVEREVGRLETLLEQEVEARLMAFSKLKRPSALEHLSEEASRHGLSAARLCEMIDDTVMDLNGLRAEARILFEEAVGRAVGMLTASLHDAQLKLMEIGEDHLERARRRAIGTMELYAARLICSAFQQKDGPTSSSFGLPMPTVLHPEFYRRQVLGTVVAELSDKIRVQMSQAQPAPMRLHLRPGDPVLLPGFHARLTPVDYPARLPGLVEQNGLLQVIQGVLRGWIHH